MTARLSTRCQGAWLAVPVSLVLTFAFAGVASADEVVNDNDTDGSLACQSPAHSTIQAGVNAASPGETVVVCPGAYREQVEVIDKSVTIDGSGDNNTTLESPNSAALVSNWRGDSRRAILAVEDTSPAATPQTVNVSDVKVDGRDQGTCNPAQNFGIGYYNVAGAISDVTADNVRQPSSGCQQGNAIYALADAGAAREVTVQDSTVTDYQKNGITVNALGANITATIRDNEVAGFGPSPVIAQNGIQLFKAGGSVTGNDVTGNACDHPTACGDDVLTETMSGGILALDLPNGTEIRDNSVGGNDVGILDAAIDNVATDPTRTVSGNVVQGNRYVGIYTDEGTMNATGNEVSGSDIGMAAVSWENGATDYVPVANFNGNDVTGNDVGIQALSSGASDPPDVNAAFNRLVGNPTAVKNTSTAASVDAENNWFGSNGGPGGAVGAGVDATPFLVFGLSADPASIATGGATSQITASLATNSAGQTPAGNVFPSRTIDLSTDLGSVGDTTVANGSGAATLTSGDTAGTATVSGALDGQNASTAVAFETPATGDTGGGGTGGTQEQGPGGTQAGDQLIGGLADDVIKGLGGDDTILGGLGDDLLTGGAGADELKGGDGDDEVGGGSGPDSIDGGRGDDVIRGGAAPDSLDGGHGNDDVSGGRGQDEITADDGEKDFVNCGANVDTVEADDQDEVDSNCENVN